MNACILVVDDDPEIVGAIRYADRWKIGDVIITGRGGGSMEDLWAFNEECVARAVYDSQIPVISAVGHEPDVTIADFTADLRAATPSNAAELAVPDQNEVYAALASLGARMEQASRQRLLRERQRLERLRESRVMADPRRYFQEKRLLLDYQSRRLGHGLSASVSGQRERFARLAAALDALSPLKVLGRGYAIAQKKDGSVIASVRDACPGEPFSLRLSDGQAECVVCERKTKNT